MSDARDRVALREGGLKAAHIVRRLVQRGLCPGCGERPHLRWAGRKELEGTLPTDPCYCCYEGMRNEDGEYVPNPEFCDTFISRPNKAHGRNMQECAICSRLLIFTKVEA